jgi:release factor glutamine methyltransferase
MTGRVWGLLELLSETTRYLAGKGFRQARLDAELLLADVLDLKRLDLYLQFERQLTAAEVDAYRDHVRRRLRREPVQQITGKAAFRELTLAVTADVLVPRPETEILVQAVLDLLPAGALGPVLDVGCGSGAVSLSLAKERPGLRVVATDLSAAALQVARRNAHDLDLEAHLTFVQGDLLEPWRPGGAAFAAVVSNPPYVLTAAIACLEPEVREWEPHLALDGGADGLAVVRRLAAAAGSLLVPGGALCLEIGDGQAPAVTELLNAAGSFTDITPRRDLAGVWRIITARRES